MLKILTFGICAVALTVSSLAMAAVPPSDAISALISHQTCRNEIRKIVGPKLEKRFWIPTRIAMTNGPEKSGPEKSGPETNILQQRDSITHKVYEYWDDGRTATFRTTDLPSLKMTTYQWSFQSSCNPKIIESVVKAAVPSAQTDAFTDQDLAKLISKENSGLIYIWTPGMPLSLEGLKAIREAAKSSNLNLKIILDPLASKKGVAESQKNYQIETADTMRNASDELTARGFGLHYPSLAIYKGKYLSNRIYMGYKSAAMYRGWIQQEEKNIESELK